MKLEEFIKQLKDFVKQNPKAAKLDVIYRLDSNEDYYGDLELDLEIGTYDGLEFGTLDEYDEENPLNSIRIN